MTDSPGSAPIDFIPYFGYNENMVGKDQPSNRVVLGASRLEVSPVCFGTWQLSPRFWGDLSKKEILQAMNRALDQFF
jgi:hypothetical protein